MGSHLQISLRYLVYNLIDLKKPGRKGTTVKEVLRAEGALEMGIGDRFQKGAMCKMWGGHKTEEYECNEGRGEGRR